MIAALRVLSRLLRPAMSGAELVLAILPLLISAAEVGFRPAFVSSQGPLGLMCGHSSLETLTLT